MQSSLNRTRSAALLLAASLLAALPLAAVAGNMIPVQPGDAAGDVTGSRLPQLNSETAAAAFFKDTLGLPLSGKVGSPVPDARPKPFTEVYDTHTSGDNDEVYLFVAPRSYFDTPDLGAAMRHYVGSQPCSDFSAREVAHVRNEVGFEARRWRSSCLDTSNPGAKGYYANVMAATDGQKTFVFVVWNWRGIHWWTSTPDAALADPEAEAVWSFLAGLTKRGS